MEWNLEEALQWYKSQGAPGDQNALVNLLTELQQENGGSIPRDMPGRIAEAYGIKESYLLAIIRRMPRLRLADSHVLELCAGPNCGRHRALADFAEANPGNYTLKYVPCMRMCGKGPNLRWDGTVYHKADVELLKKLTGK